MYKKQLEILKSYFLTRVRMTEENRYSLIVIVRENTLLSMRELREIFMIGSNSHVEMKAFKKVEEDKESKKIHQQNVENLTSLGFPFV